MPLRSTINKHLRRLEKPFATFNDIAISRSALLHNFDYMNSLAELSLVIPVLKSNAYGHGIAEVSSILKERSFPYIAVDGYYESLIVQSVSKQPVLVMSAINPENFKRMKFKQSAFVVHDETTVIALGRTGRRVKVHIELETGMTRHGVSIGDLPRLLRLLSLYPHIRVEGVMSHLADADNPDDLSYTDKQSAAFDEGVGIVLAAGFRPSLLHIAQSAGSTKVISKYANAIRIGAALYGVNSLKQSDSAYSRLAGLQPVLTLSSVITKVHALSAGSTVSYGRTFKAQRDTKIGVLPLGYYEGLPRVLSNVGLVQYGSKYVTVAGRVCMNHTMIDLSQSAATVGDRLTIISSNKDSKVSLDAMSSATGLSKNEILVGLNQNIRRRIVA